MTARVRSVPTILTDLFGEDGWYEIREGVYLAPPAPPEREVDPQTLTLEDLL